MSMSHNPSNVDPNELPKNHRFLTKEEFLFNYEYNTGYDPEIQLWSHERGWIKDDHGFAGDGYGVTYCVPLDWKPKKLNKTN